jgi:MFS family permease
MSAPTRVSLGGRLQAVSKLAVFESLHTPGFRWFWLARLAASASMEMGSVAQGWLVYQITGSALALGWVSSARSVARLVLSLYGGTLADRFRRRQVLFWARAAMLVNVLGIAVLIATGAIRVWHLVLYSFLSGVISSLMMPAQKALLAQLVGRESLLNAVSLTSVGMGLMGIVGASLAGFVIASLGAEGVYFGIAALYVGALFALSRLPAGDTSNGGGRSVWLDVRNGLRYLQCAPIIWPLLGIAIVRVLFGWSYRTLMPVYSEEVLQLGARGLGILSAAPSVGSLLGSLALASLGDFQGKGRVLLGAGLAMGLALVGFANVQHFWLALLFLVVVGVARNATIITNQTLIQTNCTDEYRGRIMSMYMMTMGLLPLGTIPAGAMADRWGVPVALLVQGGLMAAVFAALWLARSRVRDLN